MSSSCYRSFLASCTDVTDLYPAPVEKADPVNEGTKKVLDELIDHIQDNDIRVLFTLAPQAGIPEHVLKERNGLRDYVRSRGCPVLDMQNSLEEIRLDLSSDYANARHTNISGSAKFTEYVARYLIDTYGFTDKRNDPGYADWQTALEKYETLIASHDKASMANFGDESMDD